MTAKRIAQVTVMLSLVLAGVFAPFPGRTAIVSAQSGLPSMCSGFQLQNTDSVNQAIADLLFYKIGDNDAVANLTVQKTIGAGGSASYYLPTAFSTLASGTYAIVVQSDRLLNALVNQVDCLTGGLSVGSSHSGVGAGEVGSPVTLPFVLSRAFGAQWSSAIAIQNAGGGDANVTIQFFRSGQSAAAESFNNPTLKAGETWWLDLSSGPYATGNLVNFSGAAKITSSQPVAAIANYAPADGSRQLSYNGVTAGDTTLYATQVTRNFAAGVYQGGLSLYNLAGTDTPIVIEFFPAGATSPIHSVPTTIPGNSALVFYMGPGGPLDSVPAMNGFNGSARVRVTSGSNTITGIFNLDSAAGSAGAANMIPLNKASTVLSFPQIVRSVGAANFQSGWQIVNTGGSTANLELKYTKTDGTVTTQSATVGAGAALSVYVGGAAGNALGTGWNGGLRITSTNGMKILGQANFVAIAPNTRDSLLIYNGFGQ